ncbi:fused MFS/spermidine synthase, partial [Candidatus Uhrbacteria bacterium]|nr:fused MFS/spermidine synthase [Candidatus Uhrbacteria bacterium]
AAAVLLVVGAVHGVRRRATVATVALVGIAFLLLPDRPPAWWLGGTVVAATDSQYQLIRIVDHPKIGDAGTSGRALIFNEGLSTQSLAVRPGDVPKGYFSLAAALPVMVSPHPMSVLILGNAGGTVGTLLGQWFPEGALDITGVELDPAVTALARATFPMFPAYPIHHVDSRVFLEQHPRRYDLIIVDAYTNQLTIPSHLVTREFMALLQQRLTPRGLVVMNINAPRRNSALLRAIAATMTEVFPMVTVGYTGDSWNYLVTGSSASTTVAPAILASLPPRVRDQVTAYVADRAVVPRDHALRVFTDDWAPVELMTDAEVFDAMRPVAR